MPAAEPNPRRQLERIYPRPAIHGPLTGMLIAGIHASIPPNDSLGHCPGSVLGALHQRDSPSDDACITNPKIQCLRELHGR
jgi:hypothetical protein